MQDTPSPFDRDEAQAYLDSVYQTDGGFILGGWGIGPHWDEGRYQHTAWKDFAYPNDETGRAQLRDDAESRCDRDDVYVCPAVFSAPRRIPENVARSHVLWADVDSGSLDPLTPGLDPLVVDSGSAEHCHAYIVLSDPVTDPSSWNRGLALATGADAKWRANSVLRLPGTVNHKRGTPVVIRDVSGRLHSETEVRSVLAPLVDEARMRTGAATFHVEGVPDPVEVSELPSGVTTYLTRADTGDRSAHGYGLVGACVRAGLTVAETLSVVLARSRYVEKYGPDKAPERVAIEHAKITAELPVFETIEMGEPERRPWGRVDLTGVLDGSHEPPSPCYLCRADGNALVYRSAVHWFYGESESGKSKIAAYACVAPMLAGEDVLYLDFESDPVVIVDWFRRLGVPDDVIRDRLDYRQPDGRIEDDRDFASILGTRYAVAVVAGVTDAMGVEGASITDTDETALWARTVPSRIARRTGAAVICVDHVVKSKDARGRFMIGSQAKMNRVEGAAYIIEPLEPIGPGRFGTLIMKVTKDRPGRVRAVSGEYRAATRSQDAAIVHVDSTDAHKTVVTVAVPGRDAPRLTPIEFSASHMEAVSLWLHGQDEPRTSRDIESSVSGRSKSIRDAIKALSEGGFITRHGRGWVSEYRYRHNENDERPE